MSTLKQIPFTRIYYSFALIYMIFMLIACNASSQQRNASDRTDGFVKLFNGTNLDGWEGDSVYWRVEGEIVIGETTSQTPPLKSNTFLIWKDGNVGDFELKTDFKITSSGNSGINYRSERVVDIPYALKGYQADIDGANNYTGQNYEERKRTTLAYRGEKVRTHLSLEGQVENNAWTGRSIEEQLGQSDSLKALIKFEDWNECHIIAKGNRLQHFINGVLMSDVSDADTSQSSLEGLLGIQIHTGPPMKVEYRNLRIKRE